ncbi:hypothetical protein [Micromonospora sagamiensis]|uniref:Uncharacterized protein n=1 Tax=Micromonospora sagamiensis TaxID=47875 RepID=A0A562WB66_9ACTN|nr:hypothetical protein [Micromonospora sagamiensis]TWJ27513.1 hypothetical protein JD81_01003 [Micromonospora sagamiensis]BCL13601.1 hypothetical protein GCM10017556_13400 [Micromonospora sagamiensis]
MDDQTANDPLVDETERERGRSAAARLFDIRRVIGGLFVAYGLIVGGTGLLDDRAAIEKAEGVRINLWAGLGMLLLGMVFLVWQWLRPAEAPAEPDSDPAR